MPRILDAGCEGAEAGKSPGPDRGETAGWTPGTGMRQNPRRHCVRSRDSIEVAPSGSAFLSLPSRLAITLASSTRWVQYVHFSITPR